MSSTSLNTHNLKNTDFSSQMFISSNANLNYNTMYNNSIKHIIPKSQSTIKRCNSKPNFSNSEAKYDLFSSSASDNQQIEFLKKSFKTRIVQLISNLQSCVSKLTPYNAADLINEQLFLEKENELALLYEEMSLIKVEYEENKNEMDRLQKIISVLEIDLNKFDSKLNEMTQKNQMLQNDNSRLQAENFDYSLQLRAMNNKMNKSLISDNDTINTISVLKDNYNQMYNELHEAIIKAKQEGENHALVIQKQYQNKTNELEHELFKLKNALNDNKDTIQTKSIQINKLFSDNDSLIKSNEAYKRIIPSLKNKIELIRYEYTTMINQTKDDINKFKGDVINITENIINTISNTTSYATIEGNDRIKQAEEKNAKLALENYRLSDQYQKINDYNKKYIMQITTLTNKLNENENDIKSSNITISKQKIEINALNDALSNKKLILLNYKKSAQISYDDIQNTIKEKIKMIKNKYIEEITKIKHDINALLKTNDYNHNDINTHKATQLIEYENTITSLKQNISGYEKALINKEKKIKELQNALSESFYSLSSGMNNIKIAHLLDNEVKQLMHKEKNPTKKYK